MLQRQEIYAQADGGERVSLKRQHPIGQGGMTHKEGDVECRNDGDTDQEKAYVAANHSKLRLIRQLVQGMALRLPAGTKSDVGQADAAPDEEIGETRQREQPGKDGRA